MPEASGPTADKCPQVEQNAGTIELKENTVVVVLGASGDLAKKKSRGIDQFVHHLR